MSSSWLKAMRAGSDIITEFHTLDDVTSVIKGSDSGVPSIDTAIHDLPFEQVGDEMHVGNARWRDIEPKLRRGDIDGAFTDMGITHTITEADQALFKKSLTDSSPDIKINDLENKTTVAKKYHSDLDVKNKGSGAELEASLSAGSKEKTKTFYNKLKKAAGPVGLGVGLFTTIIFASDMWTGLNDAVAARNGCFIASTSSGSTTCKVQSHTCGFGNAGETPCTTAQMADIIYNVRLMCLDMIDRNATDQMAAMTTTPVLTATNLEEVLADPLNIPILVAYYTTLYPAGASFDACALGMLTDDCIACDTTAQTTSLYFTDGSMLEGNQTILCVKDSTLLDTLVDVSTEMGVEIIDAVGDSISGSFSGNLFLVLVLIVFVVVGFMLYFKFKKPKNKTPTTKPEPVREQTQTQQSQENLRQQPPPQQQQRAGTSTNIFD
ncbi:ODV-E56 [Dikerogammarus haemobaphes nudivirus]|nr:ODV-E56 [Dikerogammarus haemobaphes nudivirus]